MSASGNGPSSCTTGATATPGATMNVSMLKRPMNIAWAVPSSWVSMSPWYQDRPNGPLGTWMTKKSKPVLGGSPATSTLIISTGPIDLTRTRAVAFGRHVAAAPEGTMLKQIVLSLAFWPGGVGGHASPSSAIATQASPPLLHASSRASPQVRQRRLDDIGISRRHVSFIEGPPRGRSPLLV